MRRDLGQRTILCSLPVGTSLAKRIRQAVSPYRLRHCVARSPEEVDEALDGSVEILFTNQAPATLASAPNLRWVHLLSAGINHVIDSPIFSKPNIVLTTSRGVYDVAVAEFALGLMLSLARLLPKAWAFQQEKRWCDNADRLTVFSAAELRGRTAGIIGYGAIGQEVARLCHALGMKIAALVRPQQRAGELRYAAPELRRLRKPAPGKFYPSPRGLGKLLEQSDFVVITLPLTAETRNLIGGAALARMKRTAYLINVSRGGIVNERALIRALRKQQIAGAALDVFAQEPLPSTSPLYEVPNLIITPHLSGGFNQVLERAVDLFLENFRRYTRNQPLFNCVNRVRGY